MTLSIIVAASDNNVIGANNQLLWKLPDDMKWFKEKTVKHTVIMGRKTYESLPPKMKPLPDRFNVVASKTMDKTNQNLDGLWVEDDLVEAIKKANQLSPKEEVFIVGGGEIYRQALSMVDRIYLTRVHANFDGDTFFPTLDPKQWNEVSRQAHPADEKHAYAFDFVVYERI